MYHRVMYKCTSVLYMTSEPLSPHPLFFTLFFFTFVSGLFWENTFNTLLFPVLKPSTGCSASFVTGFKPVLLYYNKLYHLRHWHLICQIVLSKFKFLKVYLWFGWCCLLGFSCFYSDENFPKSRDYHCIYNRNAFWSWIHDWWGLFSQL